MPSVDCYILSNPTDDKRYRFVCRLAEKVFANQHRLYIHTKSMQEAHHLDELLWVHSDISFLPHAMYQPDMKESTPIALGYDNDPLEHDDVLLNLSEDVPAFHSRFQRILELSEQHQPFYETHGYAVKKHTMK
ncbi:MAG: DNA polymerase III subunit chi [Gammaproteobacteria bacterium]